MRPVFAIVDCDSFYVSCERLRDPRLAGQPVVVLSNNDGCAISVSREAKALGIRGAVPIFKVRDLINRHGIRLVSPDFGFYAETSSRILKLLEAYSPAIESYSIDEAFIDLTGRVKPDLETYGRMIRQAVIERIGVPVSLGIAETKTLSKIAVHHAKKSPKAKGVVNLAGSPYRQLALERVDVGEVWGVGWRLRDKLVSQGIRTAWDLSLKDPQWAKRKYNVNFAKTVAELQGMPCFPLEVGRPRPKTVLFSRSFGQPVSDFSLLREALAAYCRKACEKLRAHKMLAGAVTVYVKTGKHRAGQQYDDESTAMLPAPTDVTPDIWRVAYPCLVKVYRSEAAYAKAGVVLHELSMREVSQLSLFEERSAAQAGGALMELMDGINRRFGGGTIVYGAEGVRSHLWRSRREYLSADASDRERFDDNILLDGPGAYFRFF